MCACLKTHLISDVHTKTTGIRFRFHPHSRAFSKVYGFDENVKRVSMDGRPKRIRYYANSSENVLVWTQPELV